MKNFAIVSKGNIITTILVADSLEDANELVEKYHLGEFAKEVIDDDITVDAPKIGWKWDGEKFFNPELSINVE